ncbi:ATPase/protein kinase (plasmid) [Persicobacter psychrovividus]|uniref:ATPase/protein kinase n=2 Tax=Persicobacter psychrovividus TaxID=387638 RepID=A0ABM7VKW1_9BACT|nr:ATPase/protein kinase [Persicobacter psychrovividus]
MAAKMRIRKRKIDVNQLADRILAKDRVALSQAITLVESTLKSDNLIARQLLEKIMPHTGKSLRIGITGVPGVGKSTFIESFGETLINKGKRIAILAIDPSSQRTRGSILGDKTRMETLANNDQAYVRPSAAGSALGGLHARTRETMLLCEAAGFDVVMIETVGVGQSEVAVSQLVDFFLLLMLAGAGDELQGIKRGIMEMCDGMVITKADSGNEDRAKMAKNQYQNALHMFPASEKGWLPKVITASSYNKTGMTETWEMICEFVEEMRTSGWFNHNRQSQNKHWMHEWIIQELKSQFYTHPIVAQQMETLEEEVMTDKRLPIMAAMELLEQYHQEIQLADDPKT